jgi:hypothetical protein
MTIRNLEASRNVLSSAVGALDPGMIHAKVAPGAKTIAEALLHIAAFEFLAVGSRAYAAGAQPPIELWDRVEPGFARELGLPEPEEASLGQITEVLGDVRSFTKSMTDRDPKILATPLTDPELEAFIDSIKQERPNLASVAGQLFVVARVSRAVHAGVDGDLSSTLTSHESYHRGQIFLQRHLLSHGA